ncbi:DUF4280 domain-containing protein [Francisella adeliensis]|uniref:DUF4280 domain-containing protein n=1 Tax=Francisella adeliensis TaxID=2007306 RepID=A0A2Z4Y0I2_9GAMM|nr:DUF4280 domain-containing protein [Francisella adeliensis]AXA34574.1 hypothetical protein CDH04_09280 [Francisella adeliensis]MBK2086298.1 DUF4280 domain-containing protein [Francisella adeliensis]MBK2096514.1 DUF4280 domain-containing protein [Francisella adeliensis]QIW12819.1 DUF4280 domain-containing protein [Francisella adeliensis]QIW14696.1 DUF4280 domain-containing protein [Francisella adeliensis]
MSELVVSGAICNCTFGATPASLIVSSNLTSKVKKLPIASVEDKEPIVNILTFGLCSSPTNPQVIAATSAALGVFTPQPCIPNIVAPWVPGSTKVRLNKIPALTSECKVNCAWQGIISINNPIQSICKLK